MLVELGIAFTTHLGFQTDDFEGFEDFNEVHPFVQVCNEKNLCSGIMKNSQGRISIFAKGRYELAPKHSIDFALLTGYRNTYVIPMVQYNYAVSEHVDVFVMPGVATDPRGISDKVNPGIVAGISFKF